MPAVSPTPPRPAPSGQAPPFSWTLERYDRAIEAGVFTGEDKVELLDGEVVAKMSQNEPHEVTTGLVSDALRDVFGEGVHLRDEKSIALSGRSKPEPDVAVVRGERRDYIGGSPTPADVLLLVEVADSSLSEDRSRKARLYAEAGVADYWIVNLQDGVLETYRTPRDGAYRDVTTHGRGGAVSPVHAPDASVAVADLLP